MGALRSCGRCEGFLPPRAGACPHCGLPVPRGRLRSLGRSLFGMAGGGAIAVTLMACYGAAYGPPPAAPADPNRCPVTEQDADGDCAATPDDCNDGDATVKPGAPDELGDGIDQNCDGADGVGPS